MKENLVSIALKYQVAVRISEEDEQTMVFLRKELLEAKTNEKKFEKQAKEAHDLIRSLKTEVNVLKRKLNESVQGELKSNVVHSSRQAKANLKDSVGTHAFALADEEVDVMMNRSKSASFLPNSGGERVRVTPFQQWKIDRFVFTPDTPMASIDHDKHTVDMMAEYATKENTEFFSNMLSRPTKSQLGKMRRIYLSQSLKSPDVTINRLPSMELSKPKTAISSSKK
jgi:hypothetical protein